MNTDNTINLMSRINERANRFILAELEKRGIMDIAPSHGAVLAAANRVEVGPGIVIVLTTRA